jgi:hypothetical protein
MMGLEAQERNHHLQGARSPDAGRIDQGKLIEGEKFAYGEDDPRNGLVMRVTGSAYREPLYEPDVWPVSSFQDLRHGWGIPPLATRLEEDDA